MTETTKTNIYQMADNLRKSIEDSVHPSTEKFKALAKIEEVKILIEKSELESEI